MFAELDADGSGLLDYRELGRVLRRGAGDDIEIAADLQAGAMGEIEVEAKNRLALREYAKDGVSARAGMEATLPAIRQVIGGQWSVPSGQCQVVSGQWSVVSSD